MSSLTLVLCQMSYFDPPNGTTVSQPAGAVNTTFECIIYFDNVRLITSWFLVNFRGSMTPQDIKTVLPETILDGDLNPGGVFPTFRNLLTFPVFLQSFHGATLYCGSGINIKMAEYYCMYM